MKAGIYDIFNHICEQYFSGDDDTTSDYISEDLMRSVIYSSWIAVQDPQDYEARSNIMWTATLVLNTLIACGKPGDWMVRMLGQAVGGYKKLDRRRESSISSGKVYNARSYLLFSYRKYIACSLQHVS